MAQTAYASTKHTYTAYRSYGPIKRVEIKKSYAFVQYDDLEDAEYALVSI